MKKFVIALVLAALLCAMIVPVSAAEAGQRPNEMWELDIMKTPVAPVLDGEVDEIYTQSDWLEFVTVRYSSPYQSNNGSDLGFKGIVYALWDASNIYVAVEVTGVELVDGMGTGDLNILGVTPQVTWAGDAFVAAGAGVGEDIAWTETDDGFVVEFTLPGTWEAGASVEQGTGADLRIVIDGVSYWACPACNLEGIESAPYCTACDVCTTLVADEVEAPATFDFGVVAAIAALVSVAGFAISKKR